MPHSQTSFESWLHNVDLNLYILVFQSTQYWLENSYVLFWGFFKRQRHITCASPYGSPCSTLPAGDLGLAMIQSVAINFSDKRIQM